MEPVGRTRNSWQYFIASVIYCQPREAAHLEPKPQSASARWLGPVSSLEPCPLPLRGCHQHLRIDADRTDPQVFPRAHATIHVDLGAQSLGHRIVAPFWL